MSSLDQLEDVWHPRTEDEKHAVRAQLDMLLADPHFCSSKRYPAFLRFVVEQTLQGNEDALKERTLGIEVFHRTADYDTSLDPVVRLSAAEVRKRLAFYYQQHEHKQEVKIDLNPGSYIPFFYKPSEDAGIPAQNPDAVVHEPETLATTRKISSGHRFWPYVAVALLSIGVTSGLSVYISQRPTVTDQFWAQITSSPGRVTLCVGDPDDIGAASLQNTPAPSTVYNELLNENHLVGSDVVSLIRAGAALESHVKPFRLVTASHAAFPQLREGSVVLVGALDNAWTMRLMQPLRFRFRTDSETASIVDRKNPTGKSWTVRLNESQSAQSNDYGVIARYRDTTIGQPVVIIAGLSSEGTEAAGEMLSDPNSLRALFKNSHQNWSTVNLEAVVQTQVVDGHPGPPRIVAIEYW
jgi:hypothetical protein